MSSSATPTEHAYNWEESDWFTERDYPGYGDSDEANSRRDIGEGDDWGGSYEFRTGTTKEQWLAFKILQQTGRVLCATTLFDPPNRPDCALWTPALAFVFDGEQIAHDPRAMHHRNEERELSEPGIVNAKTASEAWGGVNYAGESVRVEEHAGYLSGGESTGCIIADRPHDAFMHVIDTILPLTNLTPRQQREVRTWMSDEKRQGDDRDVDLLEQFLAVALTADNATDN